MHYQLIGTYLNSLNADFIHLAEVQNRHVVERLVQTYFNAPDDYSVLMLPKSSVPWPASPQGSGEAAPLCNALIVKKPWQLSSLLLHGSDVIPGLCHPFRRHVSGLFSHPDALNDPLMLLGLHLAPHSKYQVKQGHHIISLVDDFLQAKHGYHHVPFSAPMIVLGDFNCGDPSLNVYHKRQASHAGPLCHLYKLDLELDMCIDHEWHSV